jgi:hypothetical protein
MTQSTTTLWQKILGLLGLAKTPASAETSLSRSATWKRFCRTFQQADDVAQNRAGHCAIERKGARKLFKALDQAPAQLAELRQNDLLGPCEQELLAIEIARLDREVRRRTRADDEDPGRVAFQAPAKKSLHDLSERIDALQGLCRAESVHPEAAELVLAGVEADIKTLGNRTMLRQLAMARRGEAGEIRSRAQQCVDQIRAAAGQIRLTA